MDSKTFVYICIGFVAFIIIMSVYMLVGETIVERYRRKQHPEWYARYDRALRNSFNNGSKFKEMSETVINRMNMVKEDFLSGKCTEAEYKKAMKTLSADYVDAVLWFKQASDSDNVNADLLAADAYAKEHDLEWGILYED